MNHTIKHRKNGDFEVDYSKAVASDASEKCVLCGVSTDIPVSVDISFRTSYVEGAGQLCNPCFSKVYKD
jgi:hypothetical protein